MWVPPPPIDWVSWLLVGAAVLAVAGMFGYACAVTW